MLLPLNLLPYHPYPAPEEVTLLSPVFLLSVFFVLGTTAASFIAVKRWRLLPAVWGYYVITLLPVLGLVQVGDQAMADRYSYLPSLSPFLVAGLCAAWLWGKYAGAERGLTHKVAAIAVCLLVTGFIAYLTVLQTGIWKNSITLWSHVIEKDPERVPVAYINRGVILLNKGEIEKALEDFDRAIAINPLAYKAHNNRGLVFFLRKQYDIALAAFNEATAIEPSYVDAYFNRGLTFAATGRPAEAIEEFNRAIDLNPSDSAIYYRRGLVFVAVGDLERGIEDLNRAIVLNPSLYVAYTNLGVAYGRAGRFEEALQVLNKSIELQPANPFAYNNRAITYYNINRYEEALRDYNKAIDLDKNNAQSYLNRGNLYLDMGRKDMAEADFREACNLGAAEGCSLLKSKTAFK
jgi:tetratricopeptide (TPR) repeat protein